MNKEYLSIPEIAKKAKVSKQAVYKRLKTTLSEYVKVVDGHTCLDIDCLPLFESFSKPVDNMQSTVDEIQSTVDQIVEQHQVNLGNEELNLLRLEVQRLTIELNHKNELNAILREQIEQNRVDFNREIIKLEQSLNKKDQEYVNLVESIANSLASKDDDLSQLIDRLTLLFDQQQKLNLQQQNILATGNLPEQSKKEEKKSFWQRIFNK